MRKIFLIALTFVLCKTTLVFAETADEISIFDKFTLSEKSDTTHDMPLFDTVTLSKKTVPAVVDVYAYSDGSNQVFLPFDMRDLESMFFGSPRVVTSSGTGCIITEDGTIVTCAHVIKNATKIYVGLNDGRKLEATKVYSNKAADIAFLKIKASNLPHLKLASSKTSVLLGEPVLVAGNAFGLGKTSVFSGIISFINRVIDGKVVLQSNVNINVGNSGGPMVNALGEMIGMAFAIPSKAGGLAFFIPSAMIGYYYEKYVQKKPAPYWGVTAQPMTVDMLDSLGLQDKNLFGVIVVECKEDNPAAKTLKQGDVIVAVNGQKLATLEELDYFEKTSIIGEEVKLKIYRNGKMLDVSLTPVQSAEIEPEHKEINSSLLKGVKLKTSKKGYVVVEYSEGNPLFTKGDVILKINNSNVKSIKDVEEALKAESEATSVTIQRKKSIITQSISNGENGNFFSQSIEFG
jgi:S1-C subfamily serine protease